MISFVWMKNEVLTSFGFCKDNALAASKDLNR